MRILLNGSEVGALDDKKGLSDFLEALAREENRKGRAIARILFNGIETNNWDKMVDEIEINEIELVTAPIDKLFAETLSDAYDYLARLEQGLEDIGTNLQLGRKREALELLARAIEGLEWYTQVLQLIIQSKPGEATNVKERLNILNGWLREILGAGEREDYSLLADLLLYELAPEIKRNQKWLEEIIANLDLKT
ncbi:Uncharacterized [Moorella glycerini]|uniref:DUF8042 domain-containing protein n=2 Tax=Neomoorella stamsii TaxID=1266720 RepID=A0A9X7J392_9FIRM|nr:hypothetical protein MOST_20170 [Moorella stamsii]CEP68883.1 Uncharacterized [Moorella glycerini]